MQMHPYRAQEGSMSDLKYSLSPDHNYERFWSDMIESTATKGGISLGRMVFTLSVLFQRLGHYMPRSTNVFLAAHGCPTPYCYMPSVFSMLTDVMLPYENTSKQCCYGLLAYCIL